RRRGLHEGIRHRRAVPARHRGGGTALPHSTAEALTHLLPPFGRCVMAIHVASSQQGVVPSWRAGAALAASRRCDEDPLSCGPGDTGRQLPPRQAVERWWGQWAAVRGRAGPGGLLLLTQQRTRRPAD